MFGKFFHRLLPDDRRDLNCGSAGDVFAAAEDAHGQAGSVGNCLLPGRVARSAADEGDDLLADVLPVGWFYDRLMIRLSRRAGHGELASILQTEADRRDDKLYVYSRRLTVVELALMLAGSVCLAIIWRAGRAGT